MRRLSIVLSIVSFFVIAQDVVAGTHVTRSPEPSSEAIGQLATPPFRPASVPIDVPTPPEPISLLLMIAGLSGLAAVRDHRHERPPEQP